MIELLLLAAMQPAEPQSVQDEIVVIGQKLKVWRGVVTTRKGQATCKTKKSSRDKEIDAIGCGALLKCYAQAEQKLDSLKSSKMTRNERDRLTAAVRSEMSKCMGEAMNSGVKSLAERRSAE